MRFPLKVSSPQSINPDWRGQASAIYGHRQWEAALGVFGSTMDGCLQKTRKHIKNVSVSVLF
jgi:hypothetical protein